MANSNILRVWLLLPSHATKFWHPNLIWYHKNEIVDIILWNGKWKYSFMLDFEMWKSSILELPYLPLRLLSCWPPVGIWYGHFRMKVFNAMHLICGWGKVCREAFWPTYSPLSSPYATLLLTPPGKLLSIQTFLEGQSVIPVLRILLCLQHKHLMNILKGKYVFITQGTLISL